MTEIYEISAPVTCLSDLCRLCGEVDNVSISVFDEGEDSHLIETIENIIRISITDDDALPKGICTSCHDKLVGFTSFYQQCHDTQERLLEFLSIQSAIQGTDDIQELDQNEKMALADTIKGEQDDEEEEEEVFYDVEGQSDDDEDSMNVHVIVSNSEINDSTLQRMPGTSAVKMDKNSMGAIQQVKRDLIAQPFAVQSKKFRNHRTDNEATTACSGIQKVNVEYTECIENTDEEFSVDSPEIIEYHGDDMESSPEGSRRSATPNDLCRIEHSYYRDALPSPENVDDETNNSGAPVLIKGIIPITTHQPSSTSTAHRSSQVRNVKISPTSPPPLVPIQPPSRPGKIFVMNKDRAGANFFRKPGKAYIINRNKTAAAQVVASHHRNSSQLHSLSSLVCNESEDGVNVLRQGEAVVDVKSKKPFSSKQMKRNYVTKPYLILGDGSLVRLDDVDKEIPFELIPCPPMILFHSCKTGENPPRIILTRAAEDTASTLPSQPHALPDLETPTGLLVEPFPDGCSLPAFDEPEFSLVTDKPILCETNNDVTLEMNLGAPVDTSTGETKFVVMRSNVPRKDDKKKKDISTKEEPNKFKRLRVPHCPDIVKFLEYVPNTPPHARCKICRAYYQNVRQCEYHIRSKHLSQTCVFTCEICDKKFATNFSRTQHMKVSHDRTPNFMCSMCGASFRSASALKGHELRYHASELPLLCEYCGKGFYRKANYMKHKMLVHLEKKSRT